MVLSSWHSAIARVHRFIWWMQTECQLAANPQTKPIDLGCESAGRKAAIIHIHHRHFIITQPKGWYSFYHPTEGKRLSRSRHCSKGAQPMPKAVYRSGCRDKHNRPRWDSNLGPLTPQSDVLTTRPLRPAKRRTCVDSKASCGVTDCRSTLYDFDMWQSLSGDGSSGSVVRFSTMYFVLP